MNGSTTRRTGSALRLGRGLAVCAAALMMMPLALSAQAAPTPPRELTLDAAVATAMENNPAYLQQRNDVDVARSSVRSAYGGLLPSVNASSTFGYQAPGEIRIQSVVVGQEPETYFSSYNLGLNYQLSGSTLLRPSVERSQQRATERRVAGVAADLRAQVSRQYLTVLQAREQVEQAEREVARTEEHVRLAEARLEVGAGTPLDVRRAEVQQGQAEVNLVRARNERATALLALGQLMGVPLDETTVLTSDFEVFQPAWEIDEMVGVALDRNPTLLAARASVDAASTSLQSARTNYLPSLNFNLGWRGFVSQYGNLDPLVEQEMFSEQQQFEGCLQTNELFSRVGLPTSPCAAPVEADIRQALEATNTGFPFDFENQPWQASMTVSLPIFNGLDRELQIDQAKAASADARYQVRAEELRLRQEVGAALLSLRAAYETVQLQEEVRDAASEELRLAQERFRFGAASSVEVTDAQTNLAQAERDLITAVYTFHQSLATLEALVGQPLRNE